jgi:cytoskeleton protein RodZ
MGVPQTASNVTLQARKSASLVVRTSDGQVYFARQMAKGEAYRAPRMGGLIADVSDAAAFEVFVGGVSHGLAPGLQTPLGNFGG